MVRSDPVVGTVSEATMSVFRFPGRDGAIGNRRVIAAATIACLRAFISARSCTSQLGSGLHGPVGLDIRSVALAPRTPWGSAGVCPRILLLELILVPLGRATEALACRLGVLTVLRRVTIVVVPWAGVEVVVVMPPGPLTC